MQLPAGFELCEEDDLADCFWILHDGEVAAISYETPDHNDTLKAPALVGQVAILQEQDPKYMQRQCSYRSDPPLPCTQCQLLIVRCCQPPRQGCHWTLHRGLEMHVGRKP